MVTETKGGEKMKCLCKASCQDKLTKQNYEPNKVYEFTEERAKEVCEVEKGRYFKLATTQVEQVEEVSEEVVQAVANAIVEEATDTDKTVEEVVNEIVEESNEEETTEEVVEEATEKPKKSVKKSAK